MNKNVSIGACGVGLLLSLLGGLSGCAGEQARGPNAAAVRLESQATGKVYVAWSEARQDDGGLVVTGVLQRKDRVGPPIKATVEVAIVSSQGSILNQAQSDCLYVPPRRVNKVQGFERFTVRLPTVPPEGSRVRVVARAG